jgi:small subunit ribosomal protein S1
VSDNPWKQFLEAHPVGSVLEGTIKNITEFGLFVGVNDSLDGMIHLSDLSWDKTGEEAVKDYTKNATITVKVLDVDPEKERISLGVKQLSADFAETAAKIFKRGAIVTGTVCEITDKTVEVEMEDGYFGTIKKADLSRDRDLQRPDRFAVSEKVDAKVMSIDKTTRRVVLSIKAREVEEEKKVMSEYGSSDSGASLGDILGAAMKKKDEEKDA